jgi:hypothetical protein
MFPDIPHRPTPRACRFDIAPFDIADVPTRLRHGGRQTHDATRQPGTQSVHADDAPGEAVVDALPIPLEPGLAPEQKKKEFHVCKKKPDSLSAGDLFFSGRIPCGFC